MPNLTIPREQAIAIALTRHQAGESLRDIAPDLGISHVRLRAILLGDVPEQYRAAQSDSLIERIVEADDLLDNAIVKNEETGKVDVAASSVNIARAREIGRYARWDAERRLPHLFGQRQEINVTHDISDALRQISERKRASLTIESDSHRQGGEGKESLIRSIPEQNPAGSIGTVREET